MLKRALAGVSIRAPREGGDSDHALPLFFPIGFNPRPPRRGRSDWFVAEPEQVMFQSAPPAKGAMAAGGCLTMIFPVSIRAPREGGDNRCWLYQTLLDVSIRAPREGGDLIAPVKRADHPVSIRAPREGGDKGRWL